MTTIEKLILHQGENVSEIMKAYADHYAQQNLSKLKVWADIKYVGLMSEKGIEPVALEFFNLLNDFTMVEHS